MAMGGLPLVALFGIGAFAFFVQLAEEVLEGETHGWDEAVLLAMRAPGDTSNPLGPHWLEEAARDITSLGGYAVLWLVSLAAIGYLLMVRERAEAVLVAVSVAGGTALNSLLKIGFGRPRPELVSPLADVFTASFPSGHAMMSAVTYLTLGVMLAQTQEKRRAAAFILAMAAIVTVLVGVSRIYLGVHWPSDVLAGWCAGAAWAMFCWVAAAWFDMRRRAKGRG